MVLPVNRLKKGGAVVRRSSVGAELADGTKESSAAEDGTEDVPPRISRRTHEISTISRDLKPEVLELLNAQETVANGNGGNGKAVSSTPSSWASVKQRRKTVRTLEEVSYRLKSGTKDIQSDAKETVC